MKQTNRIMNWLLGCGLALMMTVSLSAQSAGERSGKVLRIKGAARYSTGNNVWQQLKVGDVLKAGTIIQTAAESYVDVVLGVSNLKPVRASAGADLSYTPKAEQDIVRVQADSVLALDKLSVIDTGTDQVTDTQLDLRSGKVFGTVKKLNSSSRYEIKLPNGVAGVRGTVYQVTAEGVVQVLSGSVVVSWVDSNGNPQTQTVNGGFKFDARTGQLSPLTETEIRQFETIQAQLILVPPTGGPSTFIIDQTTYHVSPSEGDNNPPLPNARPGSGG